MTIPKDRIILSGQPEEPLHEIKTLNIRGEIYQTRLTRKFLRKPRKSRIKQLMSFIREPLPNFVKPGDAVEVNGSC
jgi:hypothetical protein